jgi:type IV secretory pathway TrbD component
LPFFHPVYRSLNKPLTIWGLERRLFFLTALTGVGVFNFFGSLVGGLLMFAALYVAARQATRSDPQMLRILLSSARWRTLYDPAKREESRD